MEKPFVIVIEGVDGCGKKTQSELLQKHLIDLGKKVFRKSVPFYEYGSSQPVKMFLNGDFEENGGLNPYGIASLYAVDRVCAMSILKDEFQNSDIAIFDRYVQSNMLYQSARLENLCEKKKFLKWEYDFEFNKIKLPKADLVLFLDVPVEISFEISKARTEQKSGNTKDVNEENFDLLKKVYNNSKWVAKNQKWEIIKCVQNGEMLSIEEVAQNIWNIVQKRVK